MSEQHSTTQHEASSDAGSALTPPAETIDGDGETERLKTMRASLLDAETNGDSARAESFKRAIQMELYPIYPGCVEVFKAEQKRKQELRSRYLNGTTEMSKDQGDSFSGASRQQTYQSGGEEQKPDDETWVYDDLVAP